MSDPLLSIVIPTYNRCRFLEMLLERLEPQLTKEVEVLVSNNNSTDGTHEMLQRRCYNISFFHQSKNIGGVLNVVSLLKRARGRFILSVSDSDLVVDNGVRRFLLAIRENLHLGVIASECQRFIECEAMRIERKAVVHQYFEEDRLLRRGGEALEFVFWRAVSLSGLAVRRDLLDFAGVQVHYESRYPQLYLAGKAVLEADAFAIAEPLVLLREAVGKHWQYTTDFQCGAVLDIARELTGEMEDGEEVYRRVVRGRVDRVFSALMEARAHSVGGFCRTIKELAAIPEYRQHWKFWFSAGVVGGLGASATSKVNRWKKKIMLAG